MHSRETRRSEFFKVMYSIFLYQFQPLSVFFPENKSQNLIQHRTESLKQDVHIGSEGNRMGISDAECIFLLQHILFIHLIGISLTDDFIQIDEFHAAVIGNTGTNLQNISPSCSSKA